MRNALAGKIPLVSRMLRYTLGTKLDQSGLRQKLDGLGSDIEHLSASWHSPRFLVVMGRHGIDRLRRTTLRRADARAWCWCEVLKRLPTRFSQGPIVLARARKRLR